jgi:Family of unknown function (DUF5522)
MKKQELIEGVHYYMNDDGDLVFTPQYHLEKGYCCGFGCKHCPYEYENVPEPKKSYLLKLNKPPEEQ